VPEIAVQQTVPRQIGDLAPVVVENLPSERVTGGVHGGESPRVSAEAAEECVDAVHPE